MATFAELLKEYSQEAAKVEADRRAKKKLRPIEGHPFWPHEVVRDTIIFCLFMAVCFYLSAFLPYFLEAPADARGPPAVILPDWYLLWAYGALKITEDMTLLGHTVPTPFLDEGLNFVFTCGGWEGLGCKDWGPLNAKLLGLIFNAVPVIPIVIVPFIDRGKAQRPVEQPFWAAIGMAWVVYVFMLSVYSIDTVVNRDFPQFGKEYTMWTFFTWIYNTPVGGVFDWMYDVGIMKLDPSRHIDLRNFFVIFRFDLLSWLTHLLPVLTYFIVYAPLKAVQKKHGYEAKLNANYWKVR